MSYLNLNIKEEVANFPDYRVVRRKVTRGAYITDSWKDVEFTEIIADEKLGFQHNRYFGTYSAGSVVSYALRNGEDPIRALEKAKERMHELHWIIAHGAAITSHQRPQETLILVEIGMVVRFEGRLFTIQKAPNDNLRFEPYDVTTAGE